MKYSIGISAAILASSAAAFPAAMYEALAQKSASEARSDLRNAFEKRASSGFQDGFGNPGYFNAAQQYVSNQGQYKFVPPTNVNTYNGDQRGPCPGLNAMANHNYLPHNGVATIQQFIDSTYQVFGMGKDLGGFLAVYGAVIDGNGAAWSIGGPTSNLASIALLSTPQGISGSHNKYEADVSPTRPDLYEYGNDYKVILKQFQQMFDLQKDPKTANYDLSVLTPFRAARFQQSISENPYFFNGPFSGVLVQPAAYTFIYRFMANKSQEYPEGRLDQATLKSFFSITGNSGNFTWTEGYERIPDNWYKRAIGDEYTIPYFLSDVAIAAAQYPQFLDVGGNTGTNNSFTGVDLKNLTGGVYDGATLLQGDNLQCFAMQSAQQLAPDLIKGLFVDDSSALGQLRAEITKDLPVDCPQLTKIDNSQFGKYPGATYQTPSGTTHYRL